mgnify:CR=1 FL=1
MRIAVDLDEVVYAWERTARYLLRNVYPRGHKLSGLNTPFTEWEIGNTIGDNAYKWLFDEGIDAGLFRHGHVITGAMLGVRALKAAGHDLVIVTHRPEKGVRDTLAWINFHFDTEDPYPWSGINILSGGEPKTDVQWDAIVDDSPKNLEDAEAHGRLGVQFGAAWNGGGADWPAVVKGFPPDRRN